RRVPRVRPPPDLLAGAGPRAGRSRMPHGRDRVPRLQGCATGAHGAAARGDPRAARAHGRAARPPARRAARGLGPGASRRVGNARGGQGGRGGGVMETTTVPTGQAGAPSPLTVHLDEFEGPLDLLLHLARTDEIDLARLPIRRITDQYLAYLESVEFRDLDDAGAF